MSRFGFWLRSLRYYAGSHLGVLLGTALASAVLVGALCVGDSVRYTLGRQAAARIGGADAVLAGGDRFFRSALADELAGPEERSAPVLLLPAVASTPTGDRRVLDVRLLGVDGRFFGMAPEPDPARELGPKDCLLSEELARRMELGEGETLVLRVDPPSAIPRDLSLSSEDTSVALRLKVRGIIDKEAFGAFALDASPGAPANLFVDLTWLQEELELGERANLVLASSESFAERGLEPLRERLAEAWSLADAAIEVESLSSGQRELVTGRLFFDEPVVAALEAWKGAPLTAVFTYFVNRIEAAGRRIPYSMVSALGSMGSSAAEPDPLLELSAGLGPGELRLERWAVEDLGLDPAAGDAQVELSYFRVDASRRLVEASERFRLVGQVEQAGTPAGVELMPDFPGLADADSCRDWEPGTPVDLDAIRDQDEAYWDEYKGTPKAYVALGKARDMWSSRFGALTGVRFAPDAEQDLLRDLRASLNPAQLGLVLRDLRTPAIQSRNSPTDFGGLFLGLSFFLIVAALLLTTQLFLFGVEARAREHGLLTALGLGAGGLRRLVLGEAGLVALLGVLLGIPLGLAFTRAVLLGLDGLWAEAVARVSIRYHWTPLTVGIGALAAWATTLAAIAWGLRRALRVPVAQQLGASQGVTSMSEPIAARRSWIAIAVLLLVALAIAVLVDPTGGPGAAGAFFGAGALVLAAGLVFLRLRLRGRREGQAGGVWALGSTNARRRAGRSLASASLMAIGAFLVLAVGANRLGSPSDPYRRDSGTGGFAFYGTTSLPLTQDLASPEGREAFALDAEDVEGLRLVRLRLREGDDASCLNLAKPAAPTLLGVDPGALAERGAFGFAKRAAGPENPWDLLDQDLGPGVVPAIGDTTSLTWQLKLGLGDELEYLDERGQPFQVRIVGALADTILQGDLIIAESRFEELYPTQGGYQRLLVDALPERAEALRDTLTSALGDVGLSLEPSAARLDRFHGVQNTYLAIFQALGALGLLLGSVGMGLVVLRNTQERRAELALMGALGFAKGRLAAVILSEYGGLLVAGLLAGALASLVASAPLFAGEDPVGALRQVALLVGALAVTGLLSIVVVVWFVSRRPPLAVLREE